MPQHRRAGSRPRLSRTLPRPSSHPETAGALTVTELLEHWDAVLPVLEAVAADPRTVWLPLAGASLHSPVEPRQVFQAGANYRTHVIDLAAAPHDGSDGRSIDSFQLLPSLIAGTRRVAMIHELLAARLGLGPGSGIRLLDCPFDAVPVQEAPWWHPVHTNDAGHVWLRELAGVVGARIGTRQVRNLATRVTLSGNVGTDVSRQAPHRVGHPSGGLSLEGSGEVP